MSPKSSTTTATTNDSISDGRLRISTLKRTVLIEAICLSLIVPVYGSSVRARSKPNAGSTFSIKVPVHAR